MIVADVPSHGFTFEGKVENCRIRFSFNSPPIYPKPSAICGTWTPNGKFQNTAANWAAVPYNNGSVAYSVQNATFLVGRGLLLESGVRCELNLLPSPQSPNVINLWQKTEYFREVSERGCPKLPV